MDIYSLPFCVRQYILILNKVKFRRCIDYQSKISLGKLQKNSFLVVLPLSPPPPQLSGHRDFFPYIKKSYFFP